jgi:hypothetical protein
VFIRSGKIVLLAAVLASVACESNSRRETEPSYRPRNPPPAPDHTPRAMESDFGGFMLSSELSEDYLRRLETESAAADARAAEEAAAESAE